MRKSWVFIFVIGISPALARRSILIPPLSLRTVAGGSLTSGTSKIVCVTADMIPSQSYYQTVNDDGVLNVNHGWEINLVNVSQQQQKVRAIILPGTTVSSENSNGNQYAISNVNGPGFTLAEEIQSPEVVLGPKQSASYGFTFQCNNAVCKLDQRVNGSLTTIFGTPFTTYPTCDGVPQVCISVYSKMVLEIRVEEDRGAVLAEIRNGAHRCNGYADHFLSTPVNHSVNGGRAF